MMSGKSLFECGLKRTKTDFIFNFIRFNPHSNSDLK